MVVIEHESKEINSARVNREHLMIAFHFQLQTLHICPYVTQQRVQGFLVRCKNNDVIGITPIILHALFFFQPMVEIRQEKVCKVLGKIVANRNAVQGRCHQIPGVRVSDKIPNRNVSVDVGINDFIQQRQKATIFYFPLYHIFQHFMVDGWVKLANVNLQAIFQPAPDLDSSGQSLFHLSVT